VNRGVKQGCPLSAALYVIAISPILNKIKRDTRIQGVLMKSGKLCKITAYADDITIFIKNQEEMNVVREHFKVYEEISGAKLNHNKTEAIWMGSNTTPVLDIQVQHEIKILGLIISKNKCIERNWEGKESEIKEEMGKWKIANYKTRIQVIKTFVLSKLLFLATIFPPEKRVIMKLNKLCVKFIWGNNREVTKRTLLYKPKELGGLGAIELGSKLTIAFCKNIAQAMDRQSDWVGESKIWRKKTGRARQRTPYYKLIYGDFTAKYNDLDIDWTKHTNKHIYEVINNYEHGGTFKYKHLDSAESKKCIKNLNSKDISENIRDVAWLISVGRLAVRCVVKWSCYVTTKECPFSECTEDETVEHLLINCPRSVDIWQKVKDLGIDISIDERTIMYGVFGNKMKKNIEELYWLIISIVNYKIWKTRCKMIINQCHISADAVYKQIICELRRQKKIDKRTKNKFPWYLVKI
ncbi:MAG: reverse transcriptase domain-containing protein, partial [Sarcina sp.]